MTRAKFWESGGRLTGFRITGHSTTGCDDAAGRLVCAAVSSAAYLAANTLTEILGAPAEIQIDEARMELRLTGSDAESQPMLRGLRLHLEQLAAQYPEHIQVLSEVSSQC